MYIIRLALLMLLATPLYLAAQDKAAGDEAKPASAPNTLTAAQQQAVQQAMSAAEKMGANPHSRSSRA
jgi:predicted lactoylglutathione lyase